MRSGCSQTCPQILWGKEWPQLHIGNAPRCWPHRRTRPKRRAELRHNRSAPHQPGVFLAFDHTSRRLAHLALDRLLRAGHGAGDRTLRQSEGVAHRAAKPIARLLYPKRPSLKIGRGIFECELILRECSRLKSKDFQNRSPSPRAPPATCPGSPRPSTTC